MTTLKLLRDSERISGVLLLSGNMNDSETTQIPIEYSDDQRCPNKASSLYSSSEEQELNCPNSSPWNRAGEGMLLENWPFPIVLLNNNETVEFLIEKCYKKFNVPAQNVDWPLCAVEIDANMRQSVNSETCLRRSNYFSISGTTKLCDKVWSKYLKNTLNELLQILANRKVEKSIIIPILQLGDLNWFLLQEEPKETQKAYPNESIILITTRLDMVNLFDK